MKTKKRALASIAMVVLFSVLISTFPASAAPKNTFKLTGKYTSNGAVTSLEWEPVKGAQAYAIEIKRSTDSKYSLIFYYAGYANSFIRPTGKLKYNYRISTYVDGKKYVSNKVTISGTGDSKKGYDVSSILATDLEDLPNGVVGVFQTVCHFKLNKKTSGNKLKLSWDKVDGATKYTIYRRDDYGYNVLVGSTKNKATSCTITPLTKTTDYLVCATVPGGYQYSNTVFYAGEDEETWKLPIIHYGSEIKKDTSKPTADKEETSEKAEETDQSDFANDVLALVNEERATKGLSALKLDESLGKAANVRAKELPELFSHDRPDGRSCFTVFDEYNVKYWGAGENIAAGYPNAKAVFDGWKDSPGHYANMMGDFTHIGIGRDGNYWVQLFIKV